MSKKEYSVPTLKQHTVCCEAFLGTFSVPTGEEDTPEVNGEEGGANCSVWDDDDEEEEYE